ncbi:Endopolyphosphatase [Fusarium piperis]|uniref:Endopolyphosphatase n=1 Tax=Fusarium piperis TaxID=1435070 RepID=A0A9W8W2V8_9HYPO|nr:Endopolyphosphatase [Fusarium piperis]
MPLTGARLLVAASLFFQTVIPSPILNDDQRVLTTNSFPTPQNAQKPSRKLNGKFLHVTDFHPDEFYKPHSSTAEGVACHRKEGPAGTYGAETTDCDSPLALVDATLGWIRAHVKDDVDFVVWTGDTARHDSDEKLPRNSGHVLGTNRQVAQKIIETFSDNGQLDIPVIPTFGNNDFLPHNIFYPGPNKWLKAYSEIWHRFIPEEQRHSFAFGGWFEVEVIPDKLSVISLNTMYFFDRNAGVDGCADPSEPGFKHLEWLSVQLQRLRERRMKAILIGHVPPARTENKQNWDETCWQKYTLWLKQFRDVVTGSVYGHMNIDHFLFQDTNDIDLSLYDQAVNREPIQDDFSVESKSDYLVELRDSWTGLPDVAIKDLEADVEDDESDAQDDQVDELGKKKKGNKGKKKKDFKKIGGKYGERYQVSLVSPSVVPNYFPTIRVIEYNISGLENAPIWSDAFDVNAKVPEQITEIPEFDKPEDEGRQELKRDLEAERRKRKKGKKGKKKPKNPQLVVPEDPPKESLPGPAYAMQPFTFTGYTQYFANLTYINNDMTDPADGSKWRDGDFSDEVPNHDTPQPREFNYEVEYSTFTDKIFKLPDLTIRSYLRLAKRIAKQEEKGKAKPADEVDDDFEDGDNDVDLEPEEASEENPDGSDSDVDQSRKKKKGGKKGEKTTRKKSNKVWKHFLQEAFVNTIPEKQLKKWSRK